MFMRLATDVSTEIEVPRRRSSSNRRRMRRRKCKTFDIAKRYFSTLNIDL